MGFYTRVKRAGRGVLAACAFGLLLTANAFGATNDYRIESVTVNMPDISAYYHNPDESAQIEGYLGGEKLTLEETQGFEASGQTVDYYVLVDISASIPSSRFADIKESLTTFVQGMRAQDRLILMTFGDTVTEVLDGSEDRAKAAEVIGTLENHDQNTAFFEGIETAANEINDKRDNGDAEKMRAIMMIISDGKDCSDNTRSMNSTKTDLVSGGIPAYTFAVENNEGDSETEITSYRGAFSGLASETGGIPWTVDGGQAVLDGLNTAQTNVMNSQVASFKAASNKVSNKNEDFVMKFAGEKNRTDTVSVLVARGQADTVVPTATVEESGTDSLLVIYSKPVTGAKDSGNYIVTLDGKTVAVQQVVAFKEIENAYRLLIAGGLKNGEYTVEIDGITDNSNEANPLDEASAKQSVTVSDIETELVTEEPEEEPSALDQFLKWWPIVLTVVVLALIAVIVAVARSVKKKRFTVIDDHVVEIEKVESKSHISMGPDEVAPAQPQKAITLILSNGQSQPQRLDKVVDGSMFVGRSRECDIYCDDPGMSRQHFILSVEEDGCLYVQDLESRNGTKVNGITITQKQKLQNHDTIEAGSIKFTLEM